MYKKYLSPDNFLAYRSNNCHAKTMPEVRWSRPIVDNICCALPIEERKRIAIQHECPFLRDLDRLANDPVFATCNDCWGDDSERPHVCGGCCGLTFRCQVCNILFLWGAWYGAEGWFAGAPSFKAHLAKSQIHDMSTNMLALKATVEEQVLDHDRKFEADAKMVRFDYATPIWYMPKSCCWGCFVLKIWIGAGLSETERRKLKKEFENHSCFNQEIGLHVDRNLSNSVLALKGNSQFPFSQTASSTLYGDQRLFWFLEQEKQKGRHVGEKVRTPNSVAIVDFRDEQVKLRASFDELRVQQSRLYHRTFPDDHFKISIQFRRCQKYGCIDVKSRSILLSAKDKQVLDDGRSGKKLGFEKRFLDAESDFANHPAANEFCAHVRRILVDTFPKAFPLP